jgi:FHA domain
MNESSFALELLDSEGGHVLHCWELVPGVAYQIGRSPDCEILLSNPYVSRSHALLKPMGQSWELNVISRGGVFAQGSRVEMLVFENDLEFRVAERGPILRFRERSDAEADSENKTMSFDPLTMPILVLDQNQLDHDVAAIAEGDFFKNLREKAAQLRAGSGSSGSRAQAFGT